MEAESGHARPWGSKPYDPACLLRPESDRRRTYEYTVGASERFIRPLNGGPISH